MQRSAIRNAGLSLALAAGLGLGVGAVALTTALPAVADEAEFAVKMPAATCDDTCADGTYTAEAKGIGGPFEVTVAIEGGKIVSVEVGENGETPDLGGQAIATLPDLIVAANGTDGVDAYSGASITSKGICTAVADCLEQAASGTAGAQAGEPREIKVAEGLSEEDAAAVAEGMTVRIIDQYYDNFADALEVANQNGGGTVLLLADTVATDDPEKVATVGFRTSIIIKSEGDEPLTIYRAEGQTGPMLQMTDGTVTLKNVAFDGTGEKVGAPAIMISDQAVVKFGKDFTISGNESDGSAVSTDKFAASAVSVSGKDASLTLKEGCTISGNAGTGDVAAAIYNDGATVTNEGATFEDNAPADYAGTGKLKGEEI